MELKDLMKLKKLAKERIYKEYIEFLEEEEKGNYSDFKLTTFEEYIKLYELKPEHHDAIRDYERICNNCLEIINEDDMGTTELALTDGICQNCMEEGYGKWKII